jgi:hypothetical protein
VHTHCFGTDDQRIATSLFESEDATFKKATAEVADESKPAEVRAAAQGKTMRSRAQLEALELLRTQPLQHFTLPTIHPLHNGHINDALDATAAFTERPDRVERNKPRNALASAFGAETGLMAVSARIGGVEGKM